MSSMQLPLVLVQPSSWTCGMCSSSMRSTCHHSTTVCSDAGFSTCPEGTFIHASITAARKKPLECTIGWIAHYTIGVVLAVAFVGLMSGDWLAQPTLMPALLYGIGTVVFPFFLMQPSLGLGIAASRTPQPAQARLKSLLTHIVYGVGLYVCALAVR
jgi:uncharacterized membrane protein YagU involved in acid resistance